MDEIAELERRIAAALERIGRGAEWLARRPAGGPSAASGAARPDGSGEAGLQEALAAGRAANEALAAERAAAAEIAARARDAAAAQQAVIADLERRLAALTGQIGAQAGEIQRLKAANEELSATVQALREAAEADAGLIDRARAAEIEAMRAARSAEVVEIEGLLAELRPLIGEAQHA